MEDIFAQTSPELWHKRNSWIEKLLSDSEIGSYLVSEHSTALFFDMNRAYCAGAWISVVVMAVASIDSHFRETESGDNKIGTAKLFKDYYEGDDIDWLRKLRNRYVHMNLDEPFLEMDTWLKNQEQLEADATKAIQIAIKAFYQNPGT